MSSLCYVTATISVVLISSLTNNYVVGEPRNLASLTQSVQELLDIMDNDAVTHRMNLVKTAAVLTGIDSRINNQKIVLPMPTLEKSEPDPELLELKRREIFEALFMKYLTFRSLLDMKLCKTFYTHIKPKKNAAFNCNEAMESISKFYDNFTISSEVELFSILGEVAYIMRKNDKRMKKLMKESTMSFPITDLIRDWDKIPDAEKKFTEIIAQKLEEEKRRVNDISSGLSESSESTNLPDLSESDRSLWSRRSSFRKSSEINLLTKKLSKMDLEAATAALSEIIPPEDNLPIAVKSIKSEPLKNDENPSDIDLSAVKVPEKDDSLTTELRGKDESVARKSSVNNEESDRLENDEKPRNVDLSAKTPKKEDSLSTEPDKEDQSRDARKSSVNNGESDQLKNEEKPSDVDLSATKPPKKDDSPTTELGEKDQSIARKSSANDENLSSTKNFERKRSLKKDLSFEKRRPPFERRPSFERRASFERRPSFERALSYERKTLLERKPSSSRLRRMVQSADSSMAESMSFDEDGILSEEDISWLERYGFDLPTGLSGRYDPRLLQMIEEQRKAARRNEAIAGLHDLMWEEALSVFGDYLPDVDNFFNDTLNRKEAFLTSLHDMIPEGVDEITPYWDYIARQAKVLYSTNSAEGDSSLKKMREYVLEAESEKRQTVNYEKIQLASMNLLFRSKRFADFTVAF